MPRRATGSHAKGPGYRHMAPRHWKRHTLTSQRNRRIRLARCILEARVRRRPIASLCSVEGNVLTIQRQDATPHRPQDESRSSKAATKPKLHESLDMSSLPSCAERRNREMHHGISVTKLFGSAVSGPRQATTDDRSGRYQTRKPPSSSCSLREAFLRPLGKGYQVQLQYIGARIWIS